RIAVPQRIEGSNSGAEKRCCIHITQTFRYGGQCLRGSHHVLLVSAVITDPRNFQITAIAKISAPAGEACVVVAAVPADTNALPLPPLGDAGTQFIDDARDLVPWHPGILNSGPPAIFCERITVAHTTGLHLDKHVTCIRSGNLTIDNPEICSGPGNLRYLHCLCDRSGFHESFW